MSMSLREQLLAAGLGKKKAEQDERRAKEQAERRAKQRGQQEDGHADPQIDREDRDEPGLTGALEDPGL